MGLIRLVYASHSLLGDSSQRAQLDRILATARRFNLQNRVTGFLLATHGSFAQVLEGTDADVRETYGRIMADPRHTDLRILREEPAMERLFANWAMGVAEHDETTHFIFGLYGVTPERDLAAQPLEIIVDLAGELSRRPA
ncbi:BLUF domain-containing protein [Bosea sp. RAF48]|uniref:BLUF domain-containing protein n=1 Tax=Bosea sp. RAF48 TaxID=3237480 RepID=UPI003F8E45A2